MEIPLPTKKGRIALNIASKKITEQLFPGCWRQLLQQPHRIIPAAPGSIDVILEEANASGGVFGEPPLYDAKGEPYYIEPEDGRIIDDFSLWADSGNQQLVRIWGASEKLTGYTMVIDAETPKEILAQLYNISPWDEEDRELEYEQFIRELPKWIQKLGWAYVPLAGEDDLALFIVSPENTDLILKVEQRLNSAGAQTGSLQEVEGLPAVIVS